MADNTLVRKSTTSTRLQLSQAMALAVVVTWTVCAVADVGTGPTLLVMTGNVKPKSEQIESRTLEQLKGHLRLAAGQFRLHPSPAPWLTAPMMVMLGSPWPDAAGGTATWYSLVHQNLIAGLCLEQLAFAHHVNLPPPTV